MLAIKNSIITLLFVALSNFVWGQEETHYHQCLVEKNSFSAGLGAAHSFELEKAGINGRFYYNFHENICFGPEFTYFKTEDAEILDFDVVVHYIFETPWVGIYPVAGINYTVETIFHDLSRSKTEDGFGVIYGLGVHRNIKRVTFFIEYTRLNGAFNDHFLSLGAFYRFNLKVD